MCGINVIYQLNGKDDLSKLISKMNELLIHRGPDQRGIYKDKNKKIFLGHRRLSILDVSKNGHQPMQTDDKSVIISFNGEIYNFKEIRAKLADKYHFKSNTDTEVILYAYKEWGIDCVKQFNGMFAFALYDFKKDTLYVVRDRLGIKPLFYLKLKNKILISSEIKSILASKDYKRELDYEAVSSYLSYRYPLGEKTFFKEIYSLEPGSYLKISKNEFEKIRYWELKIKKNIKDKGEQYYFKEINRLFQDSVKKRMISDVPLGAYLSGGLDSSSIVAMMTKYSSSPIKTFTIGFKEENYNEFYYSNKVAKKYNTEHYEILLSKNDYIKSMQQLIKFKDAPLGVPNEVPLYLMSKELKKKITVVLSGEGADEIFSGYGKIFRSPSDYKKLSFIKKIPFAKRIPVIKRLYSNLKLKYPSLSFDNKLEHFLDQYTYFPFAEKENLFSKEMIQKVNKDKRIINLFKKEFYKYKVSYYRKISYVFEKLHLPGLLSRVDNCTMATSVEARVPFVDHRLVEFMMDVPVKYKMKWKSFNCFLDSLMLNSNQISEDKDIPKYILKKIIKNKLPKEVINRKKQGFPVPLNLWFKDNFVEIAKKELLSENSNIKKVFDQKKLRTWINKGETKDFGQKLWMILNLEYFLREYF